MSNNPKLVVAGSDQELTRRAAEVMAETIRAAIAARGKATVALSGGSTVRPIYEALAAAEGVDWSKVFVFWGDDRYVEQSNPYSNYKLAEEALLSRAPIPKANIFPVPTYDRSPALGARAYSETIRAFFGINGGQLPRFDLIQLGMGPDGHTASLFPHSAAIGKLGIAVMNHAGLAPWVDRVTFTPGVLNNAACVLFVVKGADKADMLHQTLEGPRNIKHWPAGSIQPTDGELIWLVDAAAARRLTTALG